MGGWVNGKEQIVKRSADISRPENQDGGNQKMRSPGSSFVVVLLRRMAAAGPRKQAKN